MPRECTSHATHTATHCDILQHTASHYTTLHHTTSHATWMHESCDTYEAVCCSVLQCAAVCCSVLQCVAVCCSVLQCVAVCCSVLQHMNTWVTQHAWTSHVSHTNVKCLTHICARRFVCIYGVPIMSRLLQIIDDILLQNIVSFIGLFCKRDLLF